MRAKDVVTRGMDAHSRERLSPRIGGGGEPSFGLSTLPSDVLARAAPCVHERRPGVAWTIGHGNGGRRSGTVT